jgi:hypothetical protein
LNQLNPFNQFSKLHQLQYRLLLIRKKQIQPKLLLLLLQRLGQLNQRRLIQMVLPHIQMVILSLTLQVKHLDLQLFQLSKLLQ